MGSVRGPGGRARDFAAANAMPCVAAAAALATCLFVPPDPGYLGYIDWPTLGKLASMVAAVGALREAGAFQAAAARLAARCRSLLALVLVLVVATGAASMLITNDMALLALLPLAAVALAAVGEGRLIGPVFVLQGLAANLWGMVLPFGNPQNIFLVGAYGISAGDFVRVMAPPFAISVVAVALLCVAVAGRGRDVRLVQDVPAADGPRSAVGAAVFAVCVAAVLGTVPVWAACAFAALALTVLDALAPVPSGRRWWFARTDWGLIATFAAFFVFSGNLARIEAAQSLFATWLAGGAFVPAALLSQVISNVPAAVVLARFTGDWPGLLCGVNVGGAGTPLGSLATLIVIAQFAAVRPLAAGPRGGSRPFWGCLLGLNFLALALLLAAGVLLGW